MIGPLGPTVIVPNDSGTAFQTELHASTHTSKFCAL